MMAANIVLVLISLLSIINADISRIKIGGGSPVIRYSGIIGTHYNVSLNASTEYLFEFSDPYGVSSSSPAHITVESFDASSEHPILIVLRQAKGVLSWQIPFVVGDTAYMKTSRILCPDANYYSSHNSSHQKYKLTAVDDSFFVSISSGSPISIEVRMTVLTLPNFTLTVGHEYIVPPPNEPLFQFTPSQPWYYQFRWPENETVGGNTSANYIKSVVLKVHSDDYICMTMSIQNISCPVLDLERTVGYDGFRQTMDSKGGVTLTKQEFPHGFHIVFVVNGDDEKCISSGYTSRTGNRYKIVKFEMSETISLDTFVVAVMAPLVIIVSTYILFLIAAIVCVCRPYRVPPSTSTSKHDFAGNDIAGPSGAEEEVAGPSVEPSSTVIDNQAHLRKSVAPDNVSLDEINYDTLASSQDDIFRTGRVLCLADFSKKDPRILRRKSDLYMYNLITIAVFYALPVFQLMYSYQAILQRTGNQDTCFFNFLCAYPLRISDTIVIGDFNHVFSNCGYVALGLLFILWTSRRDALHHFAVSKRAELDLELGIPQHYGLFYALGFALMMEGFLSAMYHVCPNQTNFQFDTSFMYVIAVLCMVKLYQNRHPDINASAYSTFMILALIIFVGMLGIMEDSKTFFILFSVLHILMCLWVSVQVYRMRPLSFGICRGFSQETRQEILRHPRRFITPNYPSRLGLLIVGNVSNWLLVYLGLNKQLENNFASYLLTVLLTNLVLYFVFYIAMKLICGEKVVLEPVVYIVIGTVLWGCSGYFFFSRVTTWASSPAYSRHHNEVCNFLHFYDNHDIWHFLSAGSMFCTFMVLLTLDDDLVEVDRTSISVF